MDWLLTAVGATVAGIVGAAMLAVGGWSAYHAVRMTFLVAQGVSTSRALLDHA